MLFVVLHDDQAANAEDMFASQFDGPPFDLHAHWARIIVNLWDVAEDLGVDLCAHSLGKML